MIYVPMRELQQWLGLNLIFCEFILEIEALRSHTSSTSLIIFLIEINFFIVFFFHNFLFDHNQTIKS